MREAPLTLDQVLSLLFERSDDVMFRRNLFIGLSLGILGFITTVRDSPRQTPAHAMHGER